MSVPCKITILYIYSRCLKLIKKNGVRQNNGMTLNELYNWGTMRKQT